VPEALQSIAMQAPLPVHVVALDVTRLSLEIESATYFTCVEATQNAIKHAHGACGVWIELRQTADRLCFEVRDNGPGFHASGTEGHGLRNMRDRIEGAGGQLAVESQPGRGTCVTGSVPLS
jgi:signal transduction histidine kinase